MAKVATKELAIAIDDYYELGDRRYTVNRLQPIGYKAERIVAEVTIGGTVHNFGAMAATTLTGELHNKAEVHLEGGAGYTIDADDWDDGQSISFIHTAGSVSPETLTLANFEGA